MTFKRWMLKKEHQESELISLVGREIVPHYKKLAGCVRLELLHICGTSSYLAIQVWESRTAWLSALASDDYPAWLNEYQTSLEHWDEMMLFEEEWETEDVSPGGV
jgi:quinol monooxygenase YgiN